MSRKTINWFISSIVLLFSIYISLDIVFASNIATGLRVSRGSPEVPTWLYLITGGAIIGASAFLSMLLTDRDLIEDIHSYSYSFDLNDRLIRYLGFIFGVFSVLVFLLIIYRGLVGPQLANVNLAILLVFVGGRAALTMTAYLFGNTWPLINPWRFIATKLPNGYREYRTRYGVWPAVIGLFILVYLEVVTPVNTSPFLLAIAIALYSVYTVLGAVIYKPSTWFRYCDPFSVLFRIYGYLAPIQKKDGSIKLGLPGSDLRESDVITDLSSIAFIILIIWELTFSGFIVTPPGAYLIELIAGIGLPPHLVYLLLLLAGYILFLSGYIVATRKARGTGTTYLSSRYLGYRFAPSLIGIAAGYHMAHYFNFLVSLSPSLWLSITDPLSAIPNPVILGLPFWMDSLPAVFILLGHILAVWISHGIAFRLFTSRLQAIRSQYPFIAVMVIYTMISLWLVSMPTEGAPYI